MINYKKIEMVKKYPSSPTTNLITFIDSSIIYSGNYLIVKENKDGAHHVI